MPFVVSRKKAREVAISLPGGFLSRRCFSHAVYDNGSSTKNCEAVQMPPLLQLQKLPGKGDGGWEKKVSVFLTRRSRVCGNWKCVLGQPVARAASYCLLPDTIWLWAAQNALKVGGVKFANYCHRLPLWRKYAHEVKAAKGLKRCRAKVKGVNNSARTAQWWWWVWCLMSSDVIWHIRDKLWPMPKHGSIKSTYVRCMRV